MRNSEELAVFSDRASRGNCSHAYIIEGDAGIGKLEFALECARALICTGKSKPCNICAGCKKALEGMHPDIFVLGKEKIASIDDIRGVIRRSAVMPNDADKQVFIIENAGKLREEAQNALLKIFEEPPATVAIFLLTESRSRLLPTLLSRGQRIRLEGCTDGELYAKLKGSADEASVKAAVAASHGNTGEAESLLSKERSAVRAKAAELFRLAATRDSYALISFLVTPKFKREQLALLLDEFISLVSAISKNKYGTEAVFFPESEKILPVAANMSKKTLAKLGEHALRCRISLDSNVNITAAATKLSVDLLSSAAK